MSIAWPDSIDDGVQGVLDDALHEVFDQTIPDPQSRGTMPVASSADVDRMDDDRLYIVVWVPMSVDKYLDATSAGDNYSDVDGHANNPGMVVYETLRDHGVPVPRDDPKHGARFDRDENTVSVDMVIDPDKVAADSTGDSGGDD